MEHAHGHADDYRINDFVEYQHLVKDRNAVFAAATAAGAHVLLPWSAGARRLAW
ncbi:MAG: hypothetical protein WDA23_01265 [Gemmobacter sp.]